MLIIYQCRTWAEELDYTKPNLKVMLKNYVKVSFRNILRFRGYSIINISGLAVGMACCLLILLFVQDELSFDRFHEQAENIYHITTDVILPGNEMQLVSSPAP